MTPKTLYATVAGAFLLGSAGFSSAAQELVCDQQPTSTTAASCSFRNVPERISSPRSGATEYIVEPSARERVVVQEPIGSERVVVREPIGNERVVVREPVTTATPVEAVVMRYPVDDAFPDPSPQNQAQTRVYIPREPRTISRDQRWEIAPD